MPAVSVIVPIYNVEKYLERCLDSILTQSFENFELILVDDGSTDLSGAICDEYAEKDSRIIIFHTQNSGVSSARNLGIGAAKGNYIMFCDGDDCVHPQWIETLYRAAERNPNNLCACNVLRGETPSFEGQESAEVFRLISYFELFKNGNSAFTVNKIYKKSLLQQFGILFNPAVAISEDVLFNTEYIEHCNGIVYTDLPLYYYFCNPKSASHTTRFLQLQEHLLPFSCRLPLIASEDIPSFCDIWLFYFIRLSRATFDKGNSMSFSQKMQYNQRLITSDEFQYCVLHATGKDENPIVLKILRLRNYYFLWFFEKLVHLKRKMKALGKQK